MKVRGLTVIWAGLLVFVTVAGSAAAANRDPASCLLYPYFNTIEGNFTVLTVTNVCAEEVHVRIVFVGPYNNCLPKDYWRTLTGYDTFTFLADALNQKPDMGFAYIYVVDGYGSKAEKKMDCLIGQELILGQLDGGAYGPPPPVDWLANFSVNAVSFAVGGNTVDGNGKLMLDGNEYDPAPSAIRFPRFFGQENNFYSLIYLMNFTGGKYYEANLGVRIFDDSEHEFSDQLQIPCFYFHTLDYLLPDTKEGHLQATSTDLDEIYDGTPVNQPHKKSGWIEIYGINAHYFINQFENPGIYGLLVENVGPGFAADLPWEVFGPVNNAMLWSTSPGGL